MVTQEQFVNAICVFIDNDMLPKAEGNYKIILNIAKAAMRIKPSIIFDVLKNNSFISMLNVVDEYNNVDADMLAKILTEGLGSDEITLTFGFFGNEYNMHFSAVDIQTVKRYM
jgi:hypothetical protein